MWEYIFALHHHGAGVGAAPRAGATRRKKEPAANKERLRNGRRFLNFEFIHPDSAGESIPKTYLEQSTFDILSNF